MRTPSIKAIGEAFPGYDAKLIKLLLTDEDSVQTYCDHYNLFTQTYNKPSARHARMLALNHALDMHGVEHAGQVGERGFLYINTGDAYRVTLIQFDDNKDSIFIGCWGDVVERGGYA